MINASDGMFFFIVIVHLCCGDNRHLSSVNTLEDADLYIGTRMEAIRE